MRDAAGARGDGDKPARPAAAGDCSLEEIIEHMRAHGLKLRIPEPRGCYQRPAGPRRYDPWQRRRTR
jgi:hypothetical protein